MCIRDRLSILSDDGALIYLNGKEAARLRMPKGTLDHQTYSGIQIKNENVFDKIKLPGNLLKPGKNLLAVSVHQQRADSSDLAFDLSFTPLSQPRVIPQPGKDPVPTGGKDNWAGLAARILEAAKTKKGYCLALGLGSGQLISALAAQSELHIVAIEPDSGKVAAFRKEMDSAGLYGSRVAVVTGEPLEFPLAPYMADLVVAEDTAFLRAKPAEAVRVAYRLLRPFSGVALSLIHI